MSAARRHDRGGSWLRVAVVLWGLALAVWLARPYLLLPEHGAHANHEGATYALRLLEFRDVLATGQLSPQWAGHFRLGLGSPYFGYYQPGFFYAASLVPWSVPVQRALGLTLVAFGLLGYLGLEALVRRGFGALAGWLAASLLLLSVYAGTEIAVRGDLSEFAAMMCLPPLLAALAAWFDGGRLRHAALLAVAGAVLVVTHPAIALVSFGMSAVLLLLLLAPATTRRRALGAAVALTFGVGLASFYWAPVFLEWDLVQGERAFDSGFSYASHFVSPTALLGAYHRATPIPVTLGPVLPVLVLPALAALLRRGRSARARQVVPLLLVLAAAAALVFLMSSASAPLWEGLPLLYRLQFPWRLLAPLSVLLCAFVGAGAPWLLPERGRGRTLLAGAAVLTALALSPGHTAYELDPALQVPDDAAALAQTYVQPDIANEWLPVGVKPRVLQAAERGTAVVVSAVQPPPPHFAARTEHYELHQNLLRVHVTSNAPALVILPHLFFPVGWRATLDGEPALLGTDPAGLLQVPVPAGTDGELVLRFTRTPARALGLRVSAVTLLLGSLLLAGLARQGRPPCPA